jgi:RNA polymerase sigma-70 factor (ECF subfamily)
MKDRQKLRALLQEHHTSAWGWALCCCNGDRNMAEDTLHDAYLGVLEGKAVFDGRSSFKTWLFAVIRKMAYRKRAQLLRRLRILTERVWRPASQGSGVDNDLYHAELRERMEKMLKNISVRQREVLQLVFYHDLSIEDAAQVMGVSVGAARTHYHRGKERMRPQIEKAGLVK